MPTGPIAKSTFKNNGLVLKLLEGEIVKTDRANPDYVYFDDTIINEDRLEECLEKVGVSEIETVLEAWQQIPHRIVIIGAGEGGTSLIKLFHEDKDIKIKGVVDKNRDAPGLKLAKELNIPTAHNTLELVSWEDIDVIVDVTGDRCLPELIWNKKSPGVELLGGQSAKLFWKLVEEFKYKEERTKRDLSYFTSLYQIGLMLASVGNMDEVLKTIVYKATESTLCPAGSLALFDKAKNKFFTAYSRFSSKFAKFEWELKDHGLTSRILKNKGEPIVIRNTETISDFDNPVVLAEGIKSFIAVSLIGKNEEIVGILYVDDSKPRDFSYGEDIFIKLLGTKASLAIQKIQLIDRLRAVHEINTSISLPFNLEDTLDIIINESLKLMNANEGHILLADKKKKVLKALRARGRRKEGIPDLPIQETGSISGWVAYMNEPYICNNVKKESLYYSVSDKIMSEITVPLIYGGEVIGVLDIESERENAFSEDDLEILTSIASQAAIAIKKTEFIKDRDKMHESLVHASRLISVGEVAAAVAHEVGNSLNIIGVGLRNIKENKDIKQNGNIKGIIEDIDAAIERLGSIVSRLTDYSSKVREEKEEEIDINGLLQQSLSLLKPKIEKQQVTHKDVFQPNLPLVIGNRVHLFEALNNIFLNALWAVGRKGNLDARTYYDSYNRKVIIRIADNGAGIIPQHLPKIFEPFFTTRPRGEGTGLGLYVAQKIIDRHKGSIEVESKRGKGTTFYIHLPAKEEK